MFSSRAVSLQQPFEISMAIINLFSENLPSVVCVSLVIPVRQQTVQKTQRRQKMGFVCLFSLAPTVLVVGL